MSDIYPQSVVEESRWDRMKEKLVAENKRLREALQPIMEECKNEADYWNETWNEDYHISIGITIKEVRELAAALNRESTD